MSSLVENSILRIVIDSPEKSTGGQNGWDEKEKAAMLVLSVKREALDVLYSAPEKRQRDKKTKIWKMTN